MERLSKINADELRRRMREAFEQTMDDVAQSINDARDGHLINDSEERCRDVLGEFRRLAYETAAQMRVEATEADPAFSPVDRVKHGVASRSILSCSGRIQLRRRRLRNADGVGTSAPVDDLIDVAHQSISLAVCEMGCRIAIDSASFLRASQNLDRIGQIKLSDELLRRLIESHGRAVIAWQDHEQLELDFDARECVTDQTIDQTPRSRVYVGVDGFMIPMVTQAEADKRLEKARERRKKLPRKKGVRRAALRKAVGADQRYKEFKLVAMYDQELEHKFMRVTRGGVDQAARLLRGMMEDVHLRGAGQVAAVTDGAEWIAGLITRNLPRKTTTMILDFYHASEHVHATRRVVFGEEDEAGKAWAGRLIGLLLDGPWDELWDELASKRSAVRGPTKRKSLDGLMQYLLSRREKIDYARFKAAGLKIGSGPTESGCKSEARRLKGIGMRWQAGNAESVMALEGLHQSHLWLNYWSTSRAA